VEGAKYPKQEEQGAKKITAAAVLKPEYWLDQQRGCLKHCASHSLYARYMVPFFSQIPRGKSL